MTKPGPALRDNISNASKKSSQLKGNIRDELADYIMEFVQENDRHEQARRRYDRIGGNLYYGRHWNVQMPEGRCAITCNLAKALIDHKVSIMTKQQPVPVVENADGGDPEAARMMRSAIMDWWDRSDMQEKLEQAELLGNVTRTCAIKYVWDEMLYGEHGDVDADVIPGWRLLTDPLARHSKRVRFIGDRALMLRSRAMRMYRDSAELIKDANGPMTYSVAGSTQSPIKDPWQRMTAMYPGVAAIDGLWTLAGYSSTAGMQRDVGEDFVEVVEMYYKDPELVWVTRKVRDPDTHKVQQRVAREEDGTPKFELSHMETITLEDGTPSSVPRYKLVMEDETEEVEVPKYPYYRRTTILLPDVITVDDCAWDYPHPYSLHGSGETLEGLLKKGAILEIEDEQAQLNVSLSLMMDNQRFGAHRVGIAYDGAQLQRNALSVSPGDVINVMGPKGSLDFVQFPQVASPWFEWVKLLVSMMQQIVGVSGVMQGESQGRMDSAQAYDLMAEITGSRVTKDTQRMERSIANGMEIVGAYMQKHYSRKHAIGVRQLEGNIAYTRVLPTTLQGSFRYKVLTGSTLAWTESARRQRVLEEYKEGLRDKISVWQEFNIPGWRDIMARMVKQNPVLNPSPPPRTRQQISKKPAAPAGHPAHA